MLNVTMLTVVASTRLQPYSQVLKLFEEVLTVTNTADYYAPAKITTVKSFLDRSKVGIRKPPYELLTVIVLVWAPYLKVRITFMVVFVVKSNNDLKFIVRILVNTNRVRGRESLFH